MLPSGLILAGFYEITEDSESSATWQACMARGGRVQAPWLYLPGPEPTLRVGVGAGGGREQWPNVRHQLRRNYARNGPSLPASEQSMLSL